MIKKLVILFNQNCILNLSWLININKKVKEFNKKFMINDILGSIENNTLVLVDIV